jgi:hypothetical protein
MRYLILLGLFAAVLPRTLLASEGLLIFKGNLWQKEEFARSVPYRELEKFPTVHNVTDFSGEKTRISSDLVVKDLPFPSAKDLADIRDESQVKHLEAMVAEWTTAVRKFPTSVRYLKPRIGALQQEIARFRAGEVKAGGEWMSKEALEAKRKQLARERELLMEKLAREARQMEMTTAQWQSLDEAGRQRARDARQAAMAAQLAADEQRRIDAEIQRQAAIAAARAAMKPTERLLTDEFVLPPSMSDEQGKEYTATLAKLNELLRPVRHEFGYKREAQKFVLTTPDSIHTVRPQDLTTEMRIVKSDAVVEEPATLELKTQDGKDTITTYNKKTDEVRRNGIVVIPSAEGMNLEEIQRELAKLIALASGKAPAPQTSVPEDSGEPAASTEKPAAAESR